MYFIELYHFKKKNFINGPIPGSLQDEDDKKNFKKKLIEAIVFKELYDHIFGLLSKNYNSEENNLIAFIEKKFMKTGFNPLDYGQHKSLIGCKFTKTSQLFPYVNLYATPFEKINVIKGIHKQVKQEIDEYLYLKKLPKIELNEDILIASLMTAFVNSKIENPISNMLFIQYFSFADYCIGETGILYEVK